MPLHKTISLFQVLLYGQGLVGSATMLTLAHTGNLVGLIAIFTIVLCVGIYLIHLSLESIAEAKRVYKFICVKKTKINKHDLEIRVLTERPHDFITSVKNEDKYTVKENVSAYSLCQIPRN